MGRKVTYRPSILGIISRYCWSKDGKIFMHAITGFNNLSVQFQLSSGQHVESSSPQSYFTRNILCTHNRYLRFKSCSACSTSTTTSPPLPLQNSSEYKELTI